MVGWVVWVGAAFGAEGDPRAEVVDVVRIATGRDGVRAGREGLVQRLAAACDQGSGAACALAGVSLGDRAAIERALAPACDAGDPAACLGAAWASLGPTATGEVPAGVAAPPGFVARVTAACDAGIPRGCTELGIAWTRGWPAYPHRGRARAWWSGACEAGDVRACTLLALDAGDPPPEDDVLALLTATPAEPGLAHRALERSCLAGSSVGCARLASWTGALPEAAQIETRTACAEGDVAACALAARLDLVAGTAPVEAGLAELDAACAVLPEACEEAAFLRQGAPPVAGYPEAPPTPVEVQRGLHDLRPDLHRCLLGAVGRGAVAGPPLDVSLRLAVDGQVVGAYVANPLDATHGACVTDVLRSARIFRRDATSPALVRTRLPAAHAPEIVLVPRVDASDTGAQAAHLRRDAPSWEAPLDACARPLGLAAEPALFVVDFVAHRNGALTDVVLVDGTDDDDVNACVVSWIAGHRTRHSVRMTTPMQAEIRPLRPRAGGTEVAAAGVSLDPGAPGEPVTIEMLVLSVRRARVDRHRARLSGRSIRSVEVAHRDMAQQIERMTGGRLRVDLTFRTVRGPLRPSAGDDESDEIRFDLEPHEVGPAVWVDIEPLTYDTLLIWGAIPRGYPQPALGVTFGDILFQGATLSTGLIPSRTELIENSGRPAWLLPIHEWWHQVEQRAEGYLDVGAGWPPSNHEVLQVGGRRLNPRTWIDEGNDTVIPWYEAVLGGMPSAFWAEVWGDGERLDPEGDLALGGVPLGEGILGAMWLADGVLAFGGYDTAAVDDEEDPTPPWFGVGAVLPGDASRVVVWVGSAADDAPIWTDARLEASADGERWTPLDAELTRDGDRWTFTFAPQVLNAVRVVPVVPEGALAACREIAVYAAEVD